MIPKKKYFQWRKRAFKMRNISVMNYQNVPSSPASAPFQRSPTSERKPALSFLYTFQNCMRSENDRDNITFILFPWEIKLFFQRSLWISYRKSNAQSSPLFLDIFWRHTLSCPAASNNASRCVWRGAFRTICFQSWNVALISKRYHTVSFLHFHPCFPLRVCVLWACWYAVR